MDVRIYCNLKLFFLPQTALYFFVDKENFNRVQSSHAEYTLFRIPTLYTSCH